MMSACSEVPFAADDWSSDDHSVWEREPARPDANQSRDKRPISSPRRRVPVFSKMLQKLLDRQ
jgi:hypothetical protein